MTIRFSAKRFQDFGEVVPCDSEIGPVLIRTGGGELLENGQGLLGDWQGLGRTAQLRESITKVDKRPGEVGAVAVRAGGGQLPVDRDGLLGDWQASAGRSRVDNQMPMLSSV